MLCRNFVRSLVAILFYVNEDSSCNSQVDEEPAIRTNTTILLGNIASYLNEGVCLDALISAPLYWQPTFPSTEGYATKSVHSNN